MYNKIINLDVVAQVAHGLKELNDKMVFIGGAVISLYTNDPAAEEIRPTADIDMTVDLTNYTEWVEMHERLAILGFKPDAQGQSICSYSFKDIAVDIIPVADTSLGFTNTWYQPGFDNLQKVALKNGIVINILQSPYFLATKFEAFKNRGNNDFYGSHDFEDIIYVMDNRTTIVEEILEADNHVKDYLIKELTIIKNHKQADEILSMHIHRLIQRERYPLLLEKIMRIIS